METLFINLHKGRGRPNFCFSKSQECHWQDRYIYDYVFHEFVFYHKRICNYTNDPGSHGTTLTCYSGSIWSITTPNEVIFWFYQYICIPYTKGNMNDYKCQCIFNSKYVNSLNTKPCSAEDLPVIHWSSKTQSYVKFFRTEVYGSL